MTQNKGFYGWILVGVLFVIYLINAAFTYAGASVINTCMAEALEMKRTLLGLGFSIFILVLGLASPIVAFCLNKKGIRLTLFMGSLVIVLGSLLMGLVVREAWQYVIVYGFIVGLGAAFGGVLPVQTGVTLWFTKKRSMAMGIVVSAAGVGAFIAAPLLNKVIAAANGDWRIAWFFVAGIASLAALIAILFVKNNLSALSVGLMIFCSVIGRLGSGLLGDRIEPRYIWTVCLVLVALGGVILVNATHVLLVYAYAAVMGIGFGGAYVCMVTTIGNYFGANSFASIMGAVFPIFTVANGMTPALSGLAYDKWGSYNLAFYGLSAVALIGALVIPFAKPPKMKTVKAS